MNVFTYWENPRNRKTPPYIELCLDSIRKEGGQVITPENINDYINDDDIHYKYHDLILPAHRADCIRVAVIMKYGGLWLDADTAVIDNLEFYVPDDKDFAFMRWDDGRVLNGYFFSKAGTPLMEEWLKRINSKLDMDLGQAGWTSFGEQILTPLVYDGFQSQCMEIPRSKYIPINIDRIPNVFFEEVDHRAFLKEDSVAIALNHSYFRDYFPWFIKQSKEDVLKGTFLINNILRRIVS